MDAGVWRTQNPAGGGQWNHGCLALSHRHCPQTPEQLAPGKKRSFFCAVPAELGLKSGTYEL